MRSRTVLLATTLAAFALPPAQAEDPGELACPVANMSAADRAGLGEVVATLTSATDARFERFRGMVGQCARSHGWSEAQSRFVLVYHLSDAGQATLRQSLEQRHVAVAEVEPVVLGDAEFMAAAASGQIDDGAIAAFIGRHVDLLERAAGADATAETGGLLGRFIMFRAMAEVTRRQFLAS